MPNNGIFIGDVYGIGGKEVVRHIDHNGSDTIAAIDRK